MKTIIIKNETDTEAFGIQLGKTLRKGQIVALIGDLGTGKTTLTKYIARGLGVRDVVTSPTFTLIQEYRSGRLPLYHFDVYRLDRAEDLYELGYEEYFFGEGVSVIEWADKVRELIPEEALTIYMEYGEQEGERVYQCTF